MSVQEPLNYYEVLGVDYHATTKQIRSAFRGKAKQFHPDTTDAHSLKNSDRYMYLLIKAYRLLSNFELRREYDLKHGINSQKFNFNFREFLKRRVYDHKSLARLVFYDLLHDRPRDAVMIYERYFEDELDKSLNRRSIRRRLSFYFSYSEYMDCLFLLAEAYEKQSKYLKAMRFYRNIARLESHREIFGHFFIEVRDALKRIVRVWKKGGHFQHIIHFVPSLLDIRTLKRDRVFFEQVVGQCKNKEVPRKKTHRMRDSAVSIAKGIQSKRRLQEMHS